MRRYVNWPSVTRSRSTSSLLQGAQRGNREQFERVLQKIAEANLEPYEADRLPETK